METKQTHKQTRTPAVRSTGLLAKVPSGALECEMLRRRIVVASAQIEALEIALANIRTNQLRRGREFAYQQARLLANK